jgi:hypothetical protein
MATVQDLTTQLEAARIAEKAGQIAAVEDQNRRDRELHEVERHAAAELNGLRALADVIFAAKITPSRPSPEIRGLARKFLHEGLDIFEVERLALDRVFGDRLGISRRAGQLMLRFVDLGVADDALHAALDSIEIRAWALAVERARALAGES